jgi:hypothetical protein
MMYGSNLTLGSAAGCYSVAFAFGCFGQCPRHRVQRRIAVPAFAQHVRPPSPATCMMCDVPLLCWSRCCVGYDRVGCRLLFGCFRFRLRRPVFSPITPYTTHHIHHTNTSYTTHHAYQPFSLPPTTTHSCPHKFGMVYSLLYASDALSVLIKSTQYFQSCEHPSQV